MKYYAALLFLLLSSFVAADALTSPLEQGNLDPAHFTEFSGGKESPANRKDGLEKIIWTSTTSTSWFGVSYGANDTSGTRHLRIAWKKPIPIGTVLVRGGGTLSVLKSSATYPGDLSDDSQWLTAERIAGAELTSDEVGSEEYAAWVLPPDTTTTALRFTHNAEPSDPKYEGHLGSAMVLAGRYANIAPQAIASASSQGEKSNLINNSDNDRMWRTWRNGEDGAEQVVSPEHPEYLQLTWPEKISLHALATCWTGFSAADLQIYTGPVVEVT
ncbi:MAG: hypothetical protein NWR76_10195 [Opitutales bacterium]|jgi:hypothetical protein|nr:hypothetical protein [Opitutales bacterium]